MRVHVRAVAWPGQVRSVRLRVCVCVCVCAHWSALQTRTVYVHLSPFTRTVWPDPATASQQSDRPFACVRASVRAMTRCEWVGA